MIKIKAHVSEKKRREVEDIKRLIKEYKIMGIVNLEKLPALNLMKIKSSLKDKMVLKYSKKRLMKIAFDESGDKNIQSLKDKLIGIPALIFSKEDPFKLFQLLKKSKSPAPAKMGDVAPKDILVAAGPTDFPPGPMIGELGQLGIKTAVEGGKIVIKIDKLLVKEGEVINAKNAELMSKLKIEPMEIGLNLLLTYCNNEILIRSVLDIDTDIYFDNIKLVVNEGINLAVYSGYITKETVELLIRKVVLEAEGLSSKVQLPEEEEKVSKLEENEQETQKDREDPILEEETVSEENIKTNVQEESSLEQSYLKQPFKTRVDISTGSSHETTRGVLVENVDEEKKKPQKENVDETNLEKLTPLEKELEEKYIEEAKEETDDGIVIEQKKLNEITKEDMKKAEETLKELVNKKIRGEI